MAFGGSRGRHLPVLVLAGLLSGGPLAERTVEPRLRYTQHWEPRSALPWFLLKTGLAMYACLLRQHTVCVYFSELFKIEVILTGFPAASFFFFLT